MTCRKVSFKEEDCANFHLIHVGVVEAFYVRVTPEMRWEVLSPTLECINSSIDCITTDTGLLLSCDAKFVFLLLFSVSSVHVT